MNRLYEQKKKDMESKISLLHSTLKASGPTSIDELVAMTGASKATLFRWRADHPEAFALTKHRMAAIGINPYPDADVYTFTPKPKNKDSDKLDRILSILESGSTKSNEGLPPQFYKAYNDFKDKPLSKEVIAHYEKLPNATRVHMAVHILSIATKREQGNA